MSQKNVEAFLRGSEGPTAETSRLFLQYSILRWSGIRRWLRCWEGKRRCIADMSWVVEFKNGKVIHAKAYLDHREALEATGLSE